MTQKTYLLTLLSLFILLTSFDFTEQPDDTIRIPIHAKEKPQERINITKPGSYDLTSDIYCLETGLVVHSNNVTIDLNGFSLICTQDTGKHNGILLKKIQNVEIKNGTIRDFSNRGIMGFDTIQ